MRVVRHGGEFIRGASGLSATVPRESAAPSHATKGEDLAGTGLTAAELGEGGKAHGQWAVIEKNLIERATRAIASRNSQQR